MENSCRQCGRSMPLKDLTLDTNGRLVCATCKNKSSTSAKTPWQAKPASSPLRSSPSATATARTTPTTSMTTARTPANTKPALRPASTPTPAPRPAAINTSPKVKENAYKCSKCGYTFVQNRSNPKIYAVCPFCKGPVNR